MRCICAAVMECWFQMGAGEEGDIRQVRQLMLDGGGDPEIWYTRGDAEICQCDQIRPHMIWTTKIMRVERQAAQLMNT